jgi:hypothetical protein
MDMGGELLERRERKQKANGFDEFGKDDAADTKSFDNRGKCGSLGEKNAKKEIGRERNAITEPSYDGNEGNAADSDRSGWRENPMQSQLRSNQPIESPSDSRTANEAKNGERQERSGWGDAADSDQERFCDKEQIRELERNRFGFNNIGNAWEEFPTQSPICSGDDGLSARLDGITFSKWRNESIKGYGNAVVPQVVHQIFKAIGLYESTSHETNNPGTA